MRLLTFLLCLLCSAANAGTYNAQANNYMFATTRLRINTINNVVPSGSEYFASAVTLGTPEYPINNLTCGFMGTWIQPATTSPEVVQGNDTSLDGVSLLLNGVYYPFSPFATSSTNWNIASGGYLWVTVHTPNPIRQTDTVQIITTGYTPTGQNRVGAARVKPYLNEGVLYSSSSLASYLTGGTIGNGLGSGNLQYVPSPVTCVATGWDGRPVPLLYGDSILYGNNEYINYGGPRGETGWLERGMSSTAYGARRYPAFNMGVASSKMADVPTTSQLQLRAAFFAALPNLPFNKVYIEGGTNDGSNSAANWETAFNAGWTSISATWPSAPLTQFTMPAKVTVTDQSGYTTVGGQGWTNNPWWTPSTGAGDTVNTYILTTPAPLTASLDVRPAFSGTNVGGSANTFREDIYSISCTISTTAVTAGQTFIKSSCPLNINTAIAVGTGTAQVEQAIVSSAPSTTSCPCQSSVFAAFANNHSIGDTIKETPTSDGTHASSTAYQRAADEAIGFFKSSGRLQ